ncbi:hypothetical protein FN846DRAFT_889932 [Sphaerosporella brunnea]|uniref:Uncharacterized protein n=1 Tax=Sphaerosporella brunnea TaxID=1250544 RepID=A0A5J5EY20_9PEZI|nr:hypothetical protein FN846DRAFT_889932 [Sphaerosporella brunnea]
MGGKAGVGYQAQEEKSSRQCWMPPGGVPLRLVARGLQDRCEAVVAAQSPHDGYNSPRTYRGETERRARIWKMTWVYPHSRRGAEGTGAVVKAADGIPSAKRKVPDNAGCHQAEFLFAWWHRNFREVFGGVVDTQKPHAGFAAAGARKARSLAGWYYGCSWGGRESRSWINSAVELLNKYAIRMICPYHSLRSGRYKMQSSPAPSVDMRSRDQIAFHKREFTSSALEIRRKPELDYYAPTDIQGAEALPHRIVSDIAGPGASARL